MPTQASNPGRIKLQWGHHLKADLSYLAVLTLTVLVAAAIAVFKPVGGLVALVIGLVVIVISVQSAQTAMLEGDTLPTIVVDPGRRLVATLADLSKTGRRKMVLKVFKLPRNGLPGIHCKRGTRLAYVVLYNGHQWNDYWNGFGGWFVQQATASKKAHRRAVESIPEEDWGLLAKAASRLPREIPIGQWPLADLGEDLQGGSQALGTIIKLAGGGIIGVVALIIVVSQVPKIFRGAVEAPELQELDVSQEERKNLLEVDRLGPIGKGMQVKQSSNPQRHGIVEKVFGNHTADVRWEDGTLSQNVSIAGLQPIRQTEKSPQDRRAVTGGSSPAEAASSQSSFPAVSSQPVEGAPSRSEQMSFNREARMAFAKTMRNVGSSIEVEVYGLVIGLAVGGKDNVYAAATNISTAAVHSGILKAGERGKIRITVVESQEGNVAEKRFGIVSHPIRGRQPCYLIEKID